MDQFKTVAFLEKAKELSLAHMDDAPPFRREDLYSAKMWVLGVIDAIYSNGYEIVEKKKETK